MKITPLYCLISTYDDAKDTKNSYTFCYFESGGEIKKAFPNRKEDENLVLFIVKMKEA